METLLEIFGANVAAFRAQKEWRQVDLADAVGCTEQTIYDVESKRSPPSFATAERIAASGEPYTSILAELNNQARKQRKPRKIQRGIMTGATLVKFRGSWDEMKAACGVFDDPA